MTAQILLIADYRVPNGLATALRSRAGPVAVVEDGRAAMQLLAIAHLEPNLVLVDVHGQIHGKRRSDRGQR